MADVHPTCCDCDPCLNGSGGLRLRRAGRLQATPPQEGSVHPDASALVREETNRQVRANRRARRLAAGAGL